MSDKVELVPVPFSRWLVVLLLLLAGPMSALYFQAREYFTSIHEDSIQSKKVQIERYLAEYLREGTTAFQLNRAFRLYFDHQDGFIDREANLSELADIFRYFRAFPGMSIPDRFSAAASAKRKRLNRRFEKLIPGIQIYTLTHDGKIDHSRSNSGDYTYIVKKLAQAVYYGRQYRKSDRVNKSFREKEDGILNSLKKFFEPGTNLSDFSKRFGQAIELRRSNGKALYIGWGYSKASSGKETLGTMLLVEEDALPVDFGLSMKLLPDLKATKTTSTTDIAWVDLKKRTDGHCSVRLDPAVRSEILSLLPRQASGYFIKRNILGLVKRDISRIVICAFSDISDLNREHEKRLEYLKITALLLFIPPLLVVTIFRERGGMALSIRWQVMGLFMITIFLPALATIQMGYDLLRYTRRAMQEKAYETLASLGADIEGNVNLGMEYFENEGGKFVDALAGCAIIPSEVKKNHAAVDKMVLDIKGKVSFTHLFLLDHKAEVFYFYSRNESEGKQLQPLISAIARIKLELLGRDVPIDMKGVAQGALIDELMHSSGAGNIQEIRKILRTEGNTVFNLRALDRTLYCFIGTYLHENNPENIRIVGIVNRDAHFESRYIDLAIESLYKRKMASNHVQVYGIENNADPAELFLPHIIADSGLNKAQYEDERRMLISMARSTLRTRTPLKSRACIGNDSFLFMSLSPKTLTRYSLIMLYDERIIEDAIENLQRLLLAFIAFSLAITLILARILARGIVLPIRTLQTGVARIAQGNFNTEVLMPGRDEFVELSEAFNNMSRGLAERQRMTRFLSRSAVEAARTDDTIGLGGKRIPAAILFSDIRSFTTISEANSAESVVSLLNSYFAAMTQVIENFHGDIDKFIGDAVMAIFYADAEGGTSMEKLAERAVKAALNMMSRLDEFNRERLKDGLFPIAIGVGISFGEVISGNIGAPGRMDHTVIGDTVNVASRLEGMSKLGKHTHIIISRRMYELLLGKIEVERLETTSVKGKTEAVEMFEIVQWLKDDLN